MNTITLPKNVFEELVNRISRLEAVVFGKAKKESTDEKVTLSPRAKKRYKQVEKDLKEGKNVYRFEDAEKGLKFLIADKR